MPENKDSERSLSDVQLDDFDVKRQRERLERSRADNQQSEHTKQPQQPGQGTRQGDAGSS
ncbi:hypothetical protein [Massilia sp. MS-15]|uniref:hypothetical protein n=1 Tax=Massilia sp. MS-15 TaxID=2878200 RepID=UPI001CD5BF7E|nr:hypothetical protein [Massilia sp. MS-15]MCA1248768.1 hypothetical protein [Massilia sp. MS-15]